jgi:hypothetical protein
MATISIEGFIEIKKSKKKSYFSDYITAALLRSRIKSDVIESYLAAVLSKPRALIKASLITFFNSSYIFTKSVSDIETKEASVIRNPKVLRQSYLFIYIIMLKLKKGHL